MTRVQFLGARLERKIIQMVEQTAKEERVDKTQALKELLLLGRKQYLINKHIELYRRGLCSVDKAAEEVGITMVEMMQEVVKAGLKSTETIEEYKKGLALLQ